MNRDSKDAGRNWQRVEFDFYGTPEGSWDDAHQTLVGEVREHSGGIVLSIEGDDGPYVIKGAPSAVGGFAGKHVGFDDDSDVTAHWNSIGDRQVGAWLEDGAFYLFTFVLKGYSRRRG